MPRPTRQRVIVGIGEALLCEYPERIEPGGLALRVAMHAAQLGHVGVAVSRLGQDAAGEELLRLVRERAIRTEHLQSDPDLATGKLTQRSIAGRTSSALTPRAAFDNLQWDFDLVDVAQQAEGVVFGQLARREGQSQSIIKRFLAECRNAVRVFDLTNRADDRVDRGDAMTGLEFAEGLIVDPLALRALQPARSGDDERAAAVEIINDSNLIFVAIRARSDEKAESTQRFIIHTAAETFESREKWPAGFTEAATVGLLHGLLSGWDFPRSLAMAATLAQHAHDHPRDPLPQNGTG